MHFHLPKPLHGWREFLGEVGIIVIGVLIALGAEQVVEAVHWREQVAAERASLLQEATDMDGAIRARKEQQGCVDRRLREIEQLIERQEHGQSVRITGQVGAPTAQSATRGTWQIALAGQALAHMPHDQKLAFSGAFGNFDIWDRSIQQERAPWLRLALLNYPQLIAAGDWSGIKEAYAAAAVENEHMRILAPWMLDEDTRLLPKIARYRSVDNLGKFHSYASIICRPILMSGAPKRN